MTVDSRVLRAMVEQQRELARISKSLTEQTSQLERIATALEMMFAVQVVKEGSIEDFSQHVAGTLAAVGLDGPSAGRPEE